MSLPLIFYDELKGFYKSKVMISLWIIFPVLTILLHYLSNIDTQEPSSATFTASILISSIGGMISSIILTSSIINEKDIKAYDLFLIRPIKRWQIIISKYLAVFLSITIAGLLALSIGIIYDSFQNSVPLDLLLPHIIESFITTVSVISVSCSFGILIGVISSSLVLGVIIIIFVGQYVNLLPLIPVFLEIDNSETTVSIIGLVVTIVLLIAAIFAFNKKEF